MPVKAKSMVRILTLSFCLFLVCVGGGYGADLARMNVTTVGGGVPAAAAFCSCSGAVTWCWEVSADSETITSSGGCAAASGDVSATVVSAIDLAAAASGKTGYAVTWTTAGDYYTFDVSGDDIIGDTAGTIEFDVIFTSVADNCGLFGFRYDDDNRLYVYVFDTDELLVRYVGAGNHVTAYTSAAGITTGSWYTVTVKWTQSDVNPNLYINANGATGTSNTNLTNFATAANLLQVGEMVGTACGAQIKNIKVYNAWQ